VYTKGRANKKKFRAIPMLSDLHSRKKKKPIEPNFKQMNEKKKNPIFFLFPSQPQTSTEFCLHTRDMYALNLKKEERGGQRISPGNDQQLVFSALNGSRK
jgi:hypothetical protein